MTFPNDSLPVGLGFRMPLANELLGASPSVADFIEIAPENFIGVGGKRARLLRAAAERWPVYCHGLSGDLAGSSPLDENEVGELKRFLHALRAPFYSDHLCITRAGGCTLHDLLPVPFCEEALERAAERICAFRERLEMEVAVENVSAYGLMSGTEMDELSFLKGVLERADCKWLLDVNNVYVNSVNFGFDPYAYIDAAPLDRVVQIHVAGHDQESPGLLLDTHGSAVCDEVFQLLRYTLSKMQTHVPVLLERDHQIPPFKELENELHLVRRCAGDHHGN